EVKLRDEKLDKATIDVLVRPLVDATAAINATTIALINAGIPMKDLVAAVSCVVNKDDKILLDPIAHRLII
ncbi:10772_t:CDS:2, partial [Funneliformis geosporum]